MMKMIGKALLGGIAGGFVGAKARLSQNPDIHRK